MNEIKDRINQLGYLPIFPLPLVLLPGEILPLHIFEPRYQQMIADIESGNKLFGINYIDGEQDIDGNPELGSFGCVAEVREISTQSDGRSNIIVVGTERYRLIDYLEIDKPYLTADVEVVNIETVDHDDLTEAANELKELFNRLAKAAYDASGNRGVFPGIPDAEPDKLAYYAGIAVNLEYKEKYRLLEMSDTLERVRSVIGHISRFILKAEEQANVIKMATTNGHSKNRIDI